MKNFKKFIFGTFFIFTMMLSIQAKTVNLVDFGAVPDDGNDDAVAIQNAFSELVNCGGGTLVFPSGVTEIQSRFEIVSAENNSIKFIGDKGAVVRFNADQLFTVFDFKDASQFEMEGLAFMGDSKVIYNARKVFSFENTKQIKITKCNFWGIGATESIIAFTDSFLSIEDSLFTGSAATDGLISTKSSKGLSIVNTIFENSGEFRGEIVEKPVLINQCSWVKVVNPIDSIFINRGNVRIKDTFFDSLATNHVYLENQVVAEINGVSAILPSPKTTSGIFAKNVGNIEVINSTFTQTRNSQGAFILKGNTYLNANGLILANGAKLGALEDSSQRNIGHCLGCPKILSLKK